MGFICWSVIAAVVTGMYRDWWSASADGQKALGTPERLLLWRSSLLIQNPPNCSCSSVEEKIFIWRSTPAHNNVLPRWRNPGLVGRGTFSSRCRWNIAVILLGTCTSLSSLSLQWRAGTLFLISAPGNSGVLCLVTTSHALLHAPRFNQQS